MPYSARVKQFAYAIDPQCWKSYSGCDIATKRALDARRNEALKFASENYWRVPWHAKLSPSQFPFPHYWRDIPMPELVTPWSAFKMKIMLHMATTPQYPFLATCASIENSERAHNRQRHFNRVVGELLSDGLIVARCAREGIYTATNKGKVFVEAVLSTPLPVPVEPKWKMPC